MFQKDNKKMTEHDIIFEATSFVNRIKIEHEEETDVIVGTFLLEHLQRTCENCCAKETAEWRKGWWLTSLQQSAWLCNSCGLRYGKNQYCGYCYEIYRKDLEGTKTLKSNVWIYCRICRQFTHQACEQANQQGIFDENRDYICPDCVQ